ncbi:hypothetical protein LTR67_009811 [Exophiala xenobiotica]
MSGTGLDHDSSDTLLLPDGRKLGYAQYGSRTGRAVFFVHGHPGSRIEAAHLHDIGLKLGARIIAPDRPGIGLSSPQPGRTVLDHPKDVEHLADHLKLERYGVLSQTMGRLDWSDEKRLEQHMKDLSKADKKDVEVMTDKVNARLMLRSGRETFAQGFDPTLQDGILLSKDLGFRIEDIRPDLPVQLWYGKQDVNVPLNHGETIAKRLGDRATLRVEDETHASIFFKWREQFLGDLIKRI